MEPLLRLEALTANDPGFLNCFGSPEITVMPGEVIHSFGTDSISVQSLTANIFGKDSSHGMKCQILGCDPGKLSASKQRLLLRQIGLVDWSSTNESDLSVHEFVSLPLKVAGLAQSRINHQTKAMLLKYDLMIKMHSSARELSAHDQRRLILAQALIKAPQLMIASINYYDRDRDYLMNEISRFCSYGAGALILSTKAAPGSQPLTAVPMELASVGE